jgi:hypothetical protein
MERLLRHLRWRETFCAVELQSLSLVPPRLPRRVVPHVLPSKPLPTGPASVGIPRLWGFYRHRRAGYITQVVSWLPHRGVGMLVRVHHFHRQFPKTMTFNPLLFDRLFEYVDP